LIEIAYLVARRFAKKGRPLCAIGSLGEASF